jgi:hypothetical protein
MNIIEAVRNLLISVPATTDAEATTLLKGMAGRGADQYGTKLRNWLASDPSVFPELIDVEVVDHVRDSGVDVVLTGQVSHARIGFQIKSDNDLASKDFTRDLKAQITDSKAWGLSLYVVVLACQPTKNNFDKYMHIVNEIGRAPDDFVMILMPARAGGLLRAFDFPLPALPRMKRVWPDFFTAVRQADLVSRYLDDWNGILPDERFQPPKEFETILEAVRTTPLTVVTGPPAVGKTFCAMQILWRDFQAGREVKWITPARFIETEGPIAEPQAPADMKRRIDLLTRYLGIVPRQPPLDSTEFIAAHLKPNTTVYIEDPFGKTDDEFSYSMHTFRFFDLDKFVAAISEGAERSGCRILLTSREALFERWLTEREKRGIAPLNFALRHITKNSYERDQRLALSRRLVVSREVVDAEKAASAIVGHTDIPFDVELIVRSLPHGASDEQVAEAVGQLEGDYAEKLRHQIVANTDAERLFLLLLVALNESHRSDRQNFHNAFTDLHKIIGIDGDPIKDVKSAAERYRPFISRSGVSVMEAEPGKGISFEERNDASAYHLEAVHSTVVDAITRHLQGTSMGWLEEVAASLRMPATGYASRPAQAKIALLFIKWGIGKNKGTAQEGMLKAIFDNKNGSFFSESDLMFLWDLLPEDFREEFFNYIDARSLAEASRVCSLLNVIDFPDKDAWRLLGLLLKKPGMGVGLFNFYGGHPWRYLADHLGEVPNALKEVLDRIAEKKSTLFSYALSGALIERWGEIPEAWRNAFLNPKALENKNAQDKFLIAIARNWQTVPAELKELFRKQAKSENYEIRSIAGIAAIVYHEVDPAEMEPIYSATLSDKLTYVPLQVLYQGLGDDEHDRKFAEALFERTDEAAAATMLSYLLYRGELKVDWKIRLAESCVTKGGDFSRGVLAYECLQKNISEFMGYKLPESPEGQPEIVRLAYIWAYINSEGRKPVLTDENVLTLIKGLSPQYRYLVLFNLSAQANYLPHPLEYYIEEIGATSDEDKKAIDDGLEERQPPGGTRTLYGLPIVQFIDR